MKRLMGLDLGNRSLGIALSDESRILASPYENFLFANRDFKTAAHKAVDVARQFGIEDVAIGLPLMPSGDESTRCHITRKFVAMVSSINPDLRFHFIDERHTTQEAQEILTDNKYRGKRGERIDSVAAAIILETYMHQIKV